MNYEFKGTPGPWHNVEYAGFINIQKGEYYGDPNVLDFEELKGVGEEQATHNAHLIAAAPELLEACVMHIEHDYTNGTYSVVGLSGAVLYSSSFSLNCNEYIRNAQKQAIHKALNIQ